MTVTDLFGPPGNDIAWYTDEVNENPVFRELRGVEGLLQSFDGQELEIMERLSISPERKKLSCVLELSSGGRTVNYTEEFPITKAEAQS